MREKIIILLSFFFGFIQLQAQQISFNHLTTLNGLSDNKVNCAVTDKNGFLWVGTANGLNRFDGNNCTVYLTQNQPQLCSNNIIGLLCDSKNRIWVGTYSGVTLIDQDRHFTKVVFDKKTGTNYGCAVIIESKSMGIIMYTNGHYRFNEAENKWELLQWSTDEQFKVGWRDNTRFNEDSYMQSGFSKLIILDYAQQKKRFEFPVPNLMSACRILDDEIMAVGYKGNLLRISISQNKIIKEYPLTITRNGKSVIADAVRLRRAANGQIVIATALGGLFVFNPATEKFTQFTHNPADDRSVSEDGKSLLSCDDMGNVFVYGGQGGLDYFNMNNTSVGYIPGFTGKNNELYIGGFNCLEKDRKGRLWMGSMDAVVMYDPATKQSAIYRYYYPDFNGGKRAMFIHCICVDSKDRVWAGTSAGGLGRLNESTGEFYCMSRDSIDGQPPRFPSNYVFDITEIGQDSLWVGCQKGFYIVNSNTCKVDSLKPGMQFKKDADPAVMKIVKDSRGRVWIGCWGNGLFYYDPQRSALKEVKYAGNKPTSIINSLQEVNGKMYVGSADGLSMINDDGEEIKCFDGNGKYHTGISSLIRGANGEIWLADKKILSVYNVSAKTFTAYNQTVKQDATFGFAAGVALNDSVQYWCAENGLLYFNTKKLITVPVSLNPVVYAVSTLDSVYAFSGNKKIDLPAKYNTLNFLFTTPHLYGGQDLFFQYRMDKVDKDWVDCNSGRQVRYTSLEPGNYTFRCRVSADGANWSADSNTVNIIIHPVFWQTGWFKTILIISLAAAAWWLYRRRIKKIRRDEQVKKEYEMKVAETEMQALRAQMNPHFMFNSLNSINNFILKNDPDNASGYLTKFSRLMRLILDNSRSEWVLLENELKALELYIELEAVRFDNAFTYAIDAAKDINAATVSVPPLLIQPYVENAIWHGLMHRKEPGGRIDIRLRKNNDTLQIEVEDNGVGREEALRLKSKTAIKHKSHGMKITAERMEIVNKVYNAGAGVAITDLTNEKGACGTRVLITLKYKDHDSHNT